MLNIFTDLYRFKYHLFYEMSENPVFWIFIGVVLVLVAYGIFCKGWNDTFRY